MHRGHLIIFGKYPKNLVKSIVYENGGRPDYEYAADAEGKVVRETEHV